MSKKIKLLVYVFTLVILMYITYSVYQSLLVENIVIYETDAVISAENNGGFNLDADKLHFGLIPVNSPFGYRKIEFSSPYNETMKIKMDAEGNIAKYLSYEYIGETFEDPFNFFISSRENLTIKVVFFVNNKMVREDDYFSGKIRIEVRRLSIFDKLNFWFIKQWDYYF